MKLTDVRPQRRNANKHTPRGMAALERSIQEDGWIGAITVAGDGETFDGSARIETAAVTGFDEAIVVESDGRVPVVVKRVDIPSADDPRAKRLGLAANRVASLNLEWDSDVLAALGEEIDLSQFWTRDELRDVLAQDVAPGGGDDVPAVEAGPTRTNYGELWGLGEHRLLVSDCTVAGAAERLMEGERVDLFVTDPPYGVSYADKNKFLNTIARGNCIQTPIENDHGAIEDIAEQVWRPAFYTMYDVAREGCVLYCHAPQGGDQMMMMMMMSTHWPVRHELMWLKNNHVLGRADYAYKHEPILYAWKGSGHKYYGGFQTSVLEFDKPQKSDLHPTMKPVALIERLIENSSRVDEIVGDWFAGAGPAIIACERRRRRCRAIEISERYADVCIARWELETGRPAVLLAPGTATPE